MLTLDPHGAVRAWQHVVGSASSVTRWCELSDGTRKRLAAHYHRQRRPLADLGTTDNIANASLPTPTGSAASVAADEQSAAADPELLATFQITKSTYLEDATAEGGTMAASGVASRERVVAVQFDPIAPLSRAFRVGYRPSSKAAIRQASVEVTLAGDGRPVRRSAMNVLTLNASSKLLESGRTPLIPVLFLLGGEQAIHTANGERLRTQLKRALLEVYIVPVEDVSPLASHPGPPPSSIFPSSSTCVVISP
eukprot:TRINITY_DN3826_c0_g1_i2.p1 TRINITY_DN3826_c0_g1~~TRINITY_DN3826_c0_g1_i2.p1  ORF type:complete len:252 (+),score=30.42 TRINITY_DN3826_c0_g1_i2:1127-1882(+)